MSWTEDPFFDSPEARSVDGGSTSEGLLWHEVSTRWGHSMHRMCSYYGMFPAKLAHYFIERYSPSGGVVLDPFSGRGTSILQGRADGRAVIGNDLSPLAFVLSKAKADPPSWTDLMHELGELEAAYRAASHRDVDVPSEIRMLYHENTLRQIVFLRGRLLSKPLHAWNSFELMLAGALAGIMHGAWRRNGSSQYLSISMPNTFSMAPAYVEKFIREHELRTLDQDVFERLRDKLARLYLDDLSGDAGIVLQDDATAVLAGKVKPRSVDLVLTSPPYLRVVNYGASNWIRLWLLGLDGVARDGGEGRKRLDADLDHKHGYESYRDFIERTLIATRKSLKESGVAVFVIGDVADPGKEAVPLASRVWEEVGSRTGLKMLQYIEDDLPIQNKVSRIWGDTKGQATNRDCILVLAPSDGEHQFDRGSVSWAEPYRDGGPDEAHERVEASRFR